MLLWRFVSLLILANTFEPLGSTHWPAGSYGTPRAASGCPSADGFQWRIGRRYQDTEDNNPNSFKSAEFHLDATVARNNIERSFYMKTDRSTDMKRSPWPPGKYCVYKKGGSCPASLSRGFIHWDDEGNRNRNWRSGTLPDGSYGRNTEIEFCCRTDGDKRDPISLPTLTPFFLLAYESAECQQVKWAVVNVEWIRFDNEDSRNTDNEGGSYPYGAGIRDHKIHYCYYRGCNETLTGFSGTFHSPNYPGKYPDGQYCSWRITVSLGRQIRLRFTTFNLQHENNTDSLYVYDGQETVGNLLGVFYGDHPPPQEGICSSYNHITVIFKSDKSRSYTGFRASYYAVNCLESVHWPAGSYGIPKAASGCPYDGDFEWLVGRRYQDTENDNPNNYKSAEFHLDTTVRKNDIDRSFCMKTDTSNDLKRSEWPPGKYCIYKKGGSCPANLSPGFIKWDDEDTSNINHILGTLPDGVYDRDTKIKFCCRTDGDKNDPISLPTVVPFFLLAYESAECQQVKWAVVSVEWIRFDNEDNKNADDHGGTYPHGAGSHDHKIHYCYYQGCNKTMVGATGTFHSPNFPGKYPDGQYCSWTMTVNPGQQIHLIFTDFSLQSENNTDALYLYDGENDRRELLGVFYGGYPPPKEGINSTSNHMFVIFKSDKSDSYTGFRASYYATECLACKSTPTVEQSSSRRSIYLSSSSSPHITSALMTPTVASPVIMLSYSAMEITPSYSELTSTALEKSKLAISSFSTKQIVTSPTVVSSRPEFREMTSSAVIFSTGLYSLTILSLANTQTVTTTVTGPTSCSRITEVTGSSASQATTSHFQNKSSPSNTEPVTTTTSVTKLISRDREIRSCNESLRTTSRVAPFYTKAKIISDYTELKSTSTNLLRPALKPSLNTAPVISTFIDDSSSPAIREMISSARAHPTGTHFPGTTPLPNQEELQITTSTFDASGSQISKGTSSTTSSKTAQTLASFFTQLGLTSSVPEPTVSATEQPEKLGKTYKRIGFNAAAVVLPSVLSFLSAVVILVGWLFYKRKKLTEGNPEGSISEKPQLGTKEHGYNEMDDGYIELHVISSQ